jgi:isopenicillin-N epimerase
MTFGRTLLSLWPLDPEATYLNHGTVGVTPRAVLEAQQRWRDRIERHPARFMLRELWSFTGSAADGQPLIRQAAAEVASFVGARADDLVFIDNTSTGVNAVMLWRHRHGREVLRRTCGRPGSHGGDAVSRVQRFGMCRPDCGRAH